MNLYLVTLYLFHCDPLLYMYILALNTLELLFTEYVCYEPEFWIYSYIYTDMILYRAFNQGGHWEESVEPEHFSRIAVLTADSRMSH
jgi:hypothetical protein